MPAAVTKSAAMKIANIALVAVDIVAQLRASSPTSPPNTMAA
jgi:hypothetical protein